MRQNAVDLFGKNILFLLMKKYFVYDLADKIIFLVDDLRFIIFIQNIRKIDGIFFHDLLIPFQQFDRMPTIIRKIGIFFFQCSDDPVDLILDHVRIHHGVFGMVVLVR